MKTENKYYLSIRKNKNNVFPLLIGPLNNNRIPDNYNDIDHFTSKYKDADELKEALINLNIYSEKDLNGFLVITEFKKTKENNKANYIYTKKFNSEIIFEGQKELLSNKSLYDLILEVSSMPEICNHVYNKFINTDSIVLKKLVSLFNQKSVMNNIILINESLINLIKKLSYEEKRNLVIFINKELIGFGKYKQKKLELEKGEKYA